MAGYVFAIGSDIAGPEAVIRECVQEGVYSTYVRSISSLPFEGTLADYLSMKPGDNIYFFCKRKYYGVGELVSVGPDCKYNNYPDASTPRKFQYDDVHDRLLFDKGSESPCYRWICTFKGSPAFFERGIDTDEILSYKPNTFRMLRAFWKVSFIKLGDEENDSLKEIFLLRHQEELRTGAGTIATGQATHDIIRERVAPAHTITIRPVLDGCVRGERLGHEMALEAATIEALAQDRLPILGHWDYISHQVIASPFKPIDYMDKIDVFASRYLPGTTIPCKYLVAELKKDEADITTIDQVLKYVDWVCREYAYGDYDSIEACIIAYGFPDNIGEYFRENVKRNYTQGSHPIQNREWTNLRLITYRYRNGRVEYHDETPQTV